ncbi:hypothetical protein [Rathayibacter sp. Leaf248]|uniref:hypothetical protein n=1 Tax=Rathayibacter sp. Leaf248 TaxID=2876555 RepID=UPI001E55E011|nr:hypothetical protein [Rathayibacter sp. Leaf248]
MAGQEEEAGGTLFVLPADLVARGQGVFAADDPDVRRELASATKKIRNRAGWHIATTREDTRTLRIRRDGTAWLPTLHLLELVSIVDSGVSIPVSRLSYDVAQDDDETVDGQIHGRTWSTTPGAVVATFRHGFSAVPADLETLCMQMASRALTARTGVVREQTLSASIVNSATAPGVAGGNVILENEQATVDAYAIARY